MCSVPRSCLTTSKVVATTQPLVVLVQSRLVLPPNHHRQLLPTTLLNPQHLPLPLSRPPQPQSWWPVVTVTMQGSAVGTLVTSADSNQLKVSTTNRHFQHHLNFSRRRTRRFSTAWPPPRRRKEGYLNLATLEDRCVNCLSSFFCPFSSSFSSPVTSCCLSPLLAPTATSTSFPAPAAQPSRRPLSSTTCSSRLAALQCTLPQPILPTSSAAPARPVAQPVHCFWADCWRGGDPLPQVSQSPPPLPLSHHHSCLLPFPPLPPFPLFQLPPLLSSSSNNNRSGLLFQHPYRWS